MSKLGKKLIKAADENRIWMTNPIHGGKITCHVCGGFISLSEKCIKRGERYEHLGSARCNSYLHYYGNDKPID